MLLKSQQSSHRSTSHYLFCTRSIFSEHRKSCGDELESDSSPTNEGDKENKMLWQQRSKSLEVLVDEKQNKALSQQNGHLTKEVSKFNRSAMHC